MIKLTRYKNNPIITPNSNHEWEKGGVFNCAATIFNDDVLLLYRAIGNYDTYISTLGLAKSNDGYNFTTYDARANSL